MKKNLFMIAAVAIAAVACNKDLPQEQIPVGEAKVYSAIADGNETKAVLNGKATNWENGDAILIYDGTSAAKYVTSIETPATNADFVIADGETALAGEKVLAVYPEWADGYKSSVADVVDKTLSKAYLASNQNAKAGSYDPNTAIAMAYSEDANLEFKNATALLKFTVANENVKTVTVYSIGGEKITGEWALDYNNGAPKATPAEGDASAGWVELSAGEGTFEVGTEYFISVYPQILAGGFGLEFGFEGVSAKQLVKKYESEIEFKRNVILNLGNLEFTGTIEPEEPEEVVVDYLAVVGSMLDNWASEKKMTLDGDWYVAEGIELTVADQFKFRANGDPDWTINRGAEGDADMVVIADNVETTVIQGGKNFAVATDGVYSLYINKYANKVKVVRTGDIVVVEPGTTTPGEDSEWAVYAQFGSETWSEVMMKTTTREGLFVVENKTMNAYNKLLIKKYNDTAWKVKYGSYDVNYIKADCYFAVALNGGDIYVEAAGTYDIYFDSTNTKVYLMSAGSDYASATEQIESGDAPVVESGTWLYLKPNSNWLQSNARFAVYTWDGGDQWFDMKDSDSDGIYEVLIPEGISNIIFCRMNPGASANGWGNKWNQTSDLKVPTDGTNLYTVKAGTWDKGGGTWSVK
jgi:hypothetical protein